MLPAIFTLHFYTFKRIYDFDRYNEGWSILVDQQTTLSLALPISDRSQKIAHARARSLCEAPDECPDSRSFVDVYDCIYVY